MSVSVRSQFGPSAIEKGMPPINSGNYTPQAICGDIPADFFDARTLAKFNAAVGGPAVPGVAAVYSSALSEGRRMAATVDGKPVVIAEPHSDAARPTRAPAAPQARGLKNTYH